MNTRGRDRTDERNPVATAAPEVVLSQLRGKFPGKTDEQIVRVLRGDCPVDSSGDQKAADWLAKRLQAARKQWEAVRAIESARRACLLRFRVR